MSRSCGLNGGKLAVSFPNGETTSATIVGRDPLTDLAVIQAKDITDAQPATLGKSSDLQVGQPVVAVGAPFGLESTVTSGHRECPQPAGDHPGRAGQRPRPPVFPAIQTDAAINPATPAGRWSTPPARWSASTQRSVRPRTAPLRRPGRFNRARLRHPDRRGHPDRPAAAQPPESDARAHRCRGLRRDRQVRPSGRCARQDRVARTPPPSKVGLKAGDVITKLNDTQVTDSDSLVADVRAYRPGDQVTLTVRSKSGSTRTVDVTLGSD